MSEYGDPMTFTPDYSRSSNQVALYKQPAFDLVRYLSELDEQLNDTLDLSEPMTLEEKARLLFVTENVVKTLTAFRSELNGLITADMEDEVLIVAGLPPLRRSNGTKRKAWEGQRLAHDVTKQVIEKMKEAHAETGESIPVLDAVEVVRDWLVKCGGLDNASHAWRKGWVEKLELDVNDYSSWERGTPSVRFER